MHGLDDSFERLGPKSRLENIEQSETVDVLGKLLSDAYGKFLRDGHVHGQATLLDIEIDGSFGKARRRISSRRSARGAGPGGPHVSFNFRLALCDGVIRGWVMKGVLKPCWDPTRLAAIVYTAWRHPTSMIGTYGSETHTYQG